MKKSNQEPILVTAEIIARIPGRRRANSTATAAASAASSIKKSKEYLEYKALNTPPNKLLSNKALVIISLSAITMSLLGSGLLYHTIVNYQDEIQASSDHLNSMLSSWKSSWAAFSEEKVALSPPTTSSTRLLIYQAPVHGQGLGSVMHGLYMAIALAELSKRKLVVSYNLFHQGFNATDPEMIRDFIVSKFVSGDGKQSFHIWNKGYTSTPDHVNVVLNSNEERVYMTGNSLLQSMIRQYISSQLWSDDQGNKFEGPGVEQVLELARTRFLAWFQPKPIVYETMNQLPQMRNHILHLRVGDGRSDKRSIFQFSARPWKQVREYIVLKFGVPPSSVLLLTDDVEIYSDLEDFQQPSWGKLPHSGTSNQAFAGSNENIARIWAEWVSIRDAKYVARTKSGFSGSALKLSDGISWHMMGITSQGKIIDEPEKRGEFSKPEHI